MTEIISNPNLRAKAQRLRGNQRRELLMGVAERLHPVTPGQIGMMIDSNNLERACDMLERHNQKAYNAYRALINSLPSDTPLPKFRAPFFWNPRDDQEQRAKWGSKLVEAFDAHL